MARALVHYDIDDDDKAFSDKFREFITAPNFGEVSAENALVRFKKETESVYSAEFESMQEEHWATLIAILERGAADAPPGSTILFEYPVTFGGQYMPTIEQEVIIRR